LLSGELQDILDTMVSKLMQLRGTLLASYAFMYQIGGLAGAVGLQILQTVSLDSSRSDLGPALILSSHLNTSNTSEFCSVNGSLLVSS
jgi:hypothetical protein